MSPENNMSVLDLYRKKRGAIAPIAPTYVISSTKGLEWDERRKVIAKIEKGDMPAKEVWTAVKMIRKASKSLIFATKITLTWNLFPTHSGVNKDSYSDYCYCYYCGYC